MNLHLIDGIDLSQLQDIQALTPAIRNIIESNLNFGDLQEENINYQRFYKIHQASCAALRHFNFLQIQKTNEATQQYQQFQKLKQMSEGLDLLKKQHIQKRSQLMEDTKKLQWQINEIKKEQKQIGDYKCMYCQRLFKLKQELQEHIKQKHNDIVEEVVYQRKLQREMNHPDVIMKKTQNEMEAIKDLKKLEKEVEKLPETHVNKEEELVERIGKILNKNMNQKIQQQLHILNQERELQNECEYKDKQNMKAQLYNMQGTFENFQNIMEELKLMQHNLTDEQFQTNQELKEIENKQNDIKQQRQTFVEHRTLENHQNYMKQKQIERNMLEEISNQGKSDIIDENKSWFFDSALHPKKRNVDELEQTGLGEYILPYKQNFKPIIMEDSRESVHYSHSQSREVTQNFEQSATMTSQNVPEQEDPQELYWQIQERKRLEQEQLEQERKRKEKYVQECFGELESDIDSEEDRILQREIDEQRFFQQYHKGIGNDQQYSLLIPENTTQVKQRKEQEFYDILSENFENIGSELQQVKRQEQIHNQIMENKRAIAQLDDQIKLGENIYEQKTQPQEIQEIEINLEKLKKDRKRHQDQMQKSILILQKEQNIADRNKKLKQKLQQFNQENLTQDYLLQQYESEAHTPLEDKDQNQLNSLLFKIQSQYRSQNAGQGNKQE